MADRPACSCRDGGWLGHHLRAPSARLLAVWSLWWFVNERHHAGVQPQADRAALQQQGQQPAARHGRGSSAAARSPGSPQRTAGRGRQAGGCCPPQMPRPAGCSAWGWALVGTLCEFSLLDRRPRGWSGWSGRRRPVPACSPLSSSPLALAPASRGCFIALAALKYCRCSLPVAAMQSLHAADRRHVAPPAPLPLCPQPAARAT